MACMYERCTGCSADACLKCTAPEQQGSWWSLYGHALRHEAGSSDAVHDAESLSLQAELQVLACACQLSVYLQFIWCDLVL